MNTKLILVEGIPGSGKTTTARFINDWLAKEGYAPELFLEGDWDHPADYEAVACLSQRAYADIRAQFPAQVEFLSQYTHKKNGELFFKYRKMKAKAPEMPLELYEALAQFEIYDLPAEKHCDLLLQRWQQFAAQAAAEEKVYVFECVFLQNPTTTLLAKHNLSGQVIREHISALAKAVVPLQPKIIYLAQTDARSTLEKVRDERPQAWADFVTWYLTEQAYGKAHGLSGFEGVSDFYTIRQAYELELLSTLPVFVMVLYDFASWEYRYKHIKALLTA
jgi:hypothetical protein